MTRDGFTFLVMGFTGKVAAQFKEAYIEAFNEMEKAISTSKEGEYVAKELQKYCVSYSQSVKVGSINSIFYFLHKAAEPFNCLEQDNLA